MREIPEYTTPEGFRCPECGKSCKIILLLNEFDYGPSHASHGLPGTHYPDSWGDPACDQCHASIDDYEYEEGYE